MTTILSQKDQIVLPSAVREQMRLEPGQDFEVLPESLRFLHGKASLPFLNRMKIHL